jgi:phosphoglycerate kinase
LEGGVFKLRTVQEAAVQGKRVLLRVDFNMPQHEDGGIADDTKMRASLPTIEYLLQHQARLVIISHLGRPKGRHNPKYSLRPMAEYLSVLLGQEVMLAPGCVEPEVTAMVAALGEGQAVLLENIRFYPEEEANDPDFARQLAQLGDIYVNDAFGTAHRAHVSTAGLAAYLPAYSGFLMAREVDMLTKVMDQSTGPRLAILGGAKVKDKLGLIFHLLDKMDIVLIGGGMANTFIAAEGNAVGRSLCEPELFDEARRMRKKAAELNKPLLLPVDAVVSQTLSAEAATSVVAVGQIGEDCVVGDIGPETVAAFTDMIRQAATIVWNGPVGVFEYAPFQNGTKQLAHAVAESSAVSIVGGGDSAAAVQALGLSDHITHISTGGGATLEFLEGLTLPGVQVCMREE